jgi:shikimate dehydrogenase
MYENIKFLGVIGKNIGYSMSPYIHNYFISKNNLKNIYNIFDISEHNLKSFLDIFWELGALGFNITTPYKEIIAKLIGKNSSINTLYRGEKYWLGMSSDGPGFVKSIERIDRTIYQFDNIIILGSGGVVSAIIQYFVKLKLNNLKNIFIFRRNKDRDYKFNEFSKNLPINFKNFDDLNSFIKPFKKSKNTMILQATNAGGNILDNHMSIIDNFNGVFIDLIYKNESNLYHQAVKKVITAQNGYSMLIEQARISQRYWWNDTLEYNDFKDYLLKNHAQL